MREIDDFTQKVIDIQNYLFNLTCRFNLDYESRQDLVSNTVLKALEKRDMFKEGTNFKSWITRIMFNLFINEYRKNKLHEVSSFDKDPNQIRTKLSDSFSDSTIIYEDYLKHLDYLSDTDRKIFLARLQGYSYQQLIDIFGISDGTLKSRIHKIKKRLQTTIENETRNYC